MNASRVWLLALWCACGGLCQACDLVPGDKNAGNDSNNADAGDGPRPRDDQSVPPIDDRKVLEAWLAERYYLTWSCNGGARGSQAVHARLRGCRNDALVHPPAGGGDYHVGAAAVAELLDASDNVVGHAAVVRALPDPGATGWYFFERFTPGTALPASVAVESDGTLADGRGDQGGNAQTICAACHISAAHDLVFAPSDPAM